jgi:predicted fused transcriptional regulator/phosphomethylpyrimidine kinase
VKLAVNIVLAIAAVSALVKLIPYNLSQQAKLRELTTEVAAVEGRVEQVKTDFHRHFDPRQATSVMQEQTSRVQPGQRPIVWVSPPRSASPQ